MNKKIIGGFTFSALLFVFGFASAHPDVTFTVTNTNNANITNVVSATSDSGNNDITADQDVEDGTISTGNTEVDSTTENDVNQNGSSLTVNDGSDVNANITNDNDVNMTNTQTLGADSGANLIDADQDVNGGNIDTGDATASGTIDNSGSLNVNVASFTIDMVDDANISVSNDNDINSLLNSVQPTADSGDNDIRADQDVEDGTISTGDADASGTIENDENQNEVTGTIDASGDVNVNVTNDNDVNETNGVVPDANSGANLIDAMEDVTGSVITTGRAESMLEIINRKNISIVDFDL